jgi:uncharacterized protein YbcC (UPF0753/DUF2309 family)
MTAAPRLHSSQTTTAIDDVAAVASVASCVAAVCARIAPAWPLDRAIAVNPLWGHIDAPFSVVSGRLRAWCGTSLAPPLEVFAHAAATGAVTDDDVAAVCRRHGRPPTTVRALLSTPRMPAVAQARLVDVLDRRRETTPSVATSVAASLSQHCAAFFDEHQASVAPSRAHGLYNAWRNAAQRDRSVQTLLGISGVRAFFRALPDDPLRTIAEGLRVLDVEPEHHEHYLTSLLWSLSGWAAALRYRAFIRASTDAPDTSLHELLAMWVAWEWALLSTSTDQHLPRAWHAARQQWATRRAHEAHTDDDAFVLLEAMEHHEQQRLARGFGPREIAASPRRDIHAVFCIDVRSEPMRRALEVNPAVGTSGFAGFFGLPISYTPLGASASRPQLPGPLTPTIAVHDDAPVQLGALRRLRAGLSRAWSDTFRAPAGAFNMVEAIGPTAGADLVREALLLARTSPLDSAFLDDDERCTARPRLALALDARVEQAASILRGMSLPQPLPRLLVIVGHGSQTRNNAHAAALDCGACCGHSGEVNARLLASLLNDVDVRQGLAAIDLPLPADLHVVAALHNTTTDTITVVDEDRVPATHRPALAQWQQSCEQATRAVRQWRAPSLGVAPEQVDDDVARRAVDWAEVRPEWGLVNNAAFVIGPRTRSAHLDLEGRVFLHDYDAEADATRDYRVLEGLLTAPLVVTHWINAQYYASSVAPERFGAGNKLLHNVVGGGLGVFEGNGGDLRVGLPWQSVHDGTRFRHTPLRLAAFVMAPQAAIDQVLARHAHIDRLVRHAWLSVLQVEDDGAVFRREASGWVLLSR